MNGYLLGMSDILSKPPSACSCQCCLESARLSVILESSKKELAQLKEKVSAAKRQIQKIKVTPSNAIDMTPLFVVSRFYEVSSQNGGLPWLRRTSAQLLLASQVSDRGSARVQSRDGAAAPILAGRERGRQKPICKKDIKKLFKAAILRLAILFSPDETFNRKKSKRPAGHLRTQRALLPSDQVMRVIELVPESCSACRKILIGWDKVPLRHHVTENTPVVPDITEYRRHALGCLNCGKITRASLLKGVSPSSFGPRLGALTAVCTAKYRMSKRAVKKLLTDFLGVYIALGTVTRIERQASLALAEATKEAHVEIESAQVVNADETSWVEGKAKAWLWVAVTYCLAVFKIARGRGKTEAKKILGTRFSGYLGSDRWSG